MLKVACDNAISSATPEKCFQLENSSLAFEVQAAGHCLKHLGACVCVYADRDLVFHMAVCVYTCQSSSGCRVGFY